MPEEDAAERGKYFRSLVFGREEAAPQVFAHVFRAHITESILEWVLFFFPARLPAALFCDALRPSEIQGGFGGAADLSAPAERLEELVAPLEIWVDGRLR